MVISLRLIVRTFCSLALIFAALVLFSADRAEAHGIHTTKEMPTALAGLSTDRETGIVGVTDKGTLGSGTSVETAECNRECCFLMACGSALIAKMLDIDVQTAPQRVAGMVASVIATATAPEGLRRPPKYLI
jgi:hypothetical protein